MATRKGADVQAAAISLRGESKHFRTRSGLSSPNSELIPTKKARRFIMGRLTAIWIFCGGWFYFFGELD